jgi:Fe-S-cluster containining protein
MNLEELCRVLAATTAAEYDCRFCGACCLPQEEGAGYVLLEAEDAGRVRRLRLPVVTDVRGQLRLETQPNEGPGGPRRCVALDGVVGWGCGCTIYEDRPGRCRAFEMGSAACRVARVRAGLPI